MNRNSKIFLGFAIFLLCCAFSFRFSFVDGDFDAAFTFADIISLAIGFIAAAIAMIILMQKSQKEELLDENGLELKELSKRSMNRLDNDEFV